MMRIAMADGWIKRGWKAHGPTEEKTLEHPAQQAPGQLEDERAHHQSVPELRSGPKATSGLPVVRPLSGRADHADLGVDSSLDRRTGKRESF